MISKPIPVLYFDILRDVLVNFDRKTLCRLQIVNKRFNLIIEKEFNNSPPYLILPEFKFGYRNWTMEVEKGLTVAVDLRVLQGIITSKFIRFRSLNASYSDNFHLLQQLVMNHMWINGTLELRWIREKFRPTAELNRAFANCSKLLLYGNNAISILHEINSGRCQNLQIFDDDYDPISHEIPWTKVADFLFRAVGSSNSYNCVCIATERGPDLGTTMKFINLVKKRFEAANFTLDFKLFWCWSFGEETFSEFDIQNNQTKQRLSFLIDSYALLLKTE
ncbi:hypothetical protein Ddc_02058 [Ditylenchus destructor]|nr:hypothetical protein Ddc_02058 [Ditylenchus destructor]